MERLLLTTKELANEHLRNAIMVLVACGVLKGQTGGIVLDGDDEEEMNNFTENLSTLTWNSIESMEFCKKFVDEWKTLADESFNKLQNGIVITTANVGDNIPSPVAAQ